MCGIQRIDQSVEVLRRPDAAHYSGLLRCRAKACPSCVAVRRLKTAEEIAKVAELARGAGQHLYLVTFTIRHGLNMTLEKTGHGIRTAWRTMLQGRWWQNFKAKFGGLNFCVGEEMTHGAAGWHPHLHALFFMPRELSLGEILDARSDLFERWAEIIAEQLGEACEPLPGPGVDFRPANCAEYLAKLGLELSSAGTKERGLSDNAAGRSPLELLADWLASPVDAITGELDMSRAEFKLYKEFERVMKGKKDHSWSTGLRDFRDEAKAAIKAEQLAETELIADIPAETWRQLCELANSPRIELLEVSEQLGRAGVLDWIGRKLGDDHRRDVLKWSELTRTPKPPRKQRPPSPYALYRAEQKAAGTG
jgi:hypothetical protein